MNQTRRIHNPAPAAHPVGTVVRTMAQQIARAAGAFARERTGVLPRSVTVVLNDHTLVITLDGALSPAEQALAQTPAGAVTVQEFHRRLFDSASDALRREINRITGAEVRQATTEMGPASSGVMSVFASGTIVQIFQLSEALAPDHWSENVGIGVV